MLLLQRASAGSGKTYTLARSFIGMLISIRDEDGKTRLRRPDEIEDAASHILAITFTNKATAEMKSRIIEKLTDLAGRSADAEKTDYLQHFIEKLGVAEAKIREACRLALNALLNNYSDFQISTIDSFFQTVLRTFAYEADLNDSYQVELDNAFLIDSGIDLTVRSLSEGNADPETVYWIGRLMRDAADAGSHWNMFAAGSGSRSGSLRKRLKEIVGEMEKEDFKRMKREFDGYFDRTEDYSAVIAEYAEHIEKPLREAHRQAVEAANEAAKAFSRHGLDLKANGANNLASHVQKTIGSSDIFCPVDFKYTTLQTKLADKDEACLSSKFKKHGLSTAVLGELADSVRSLYAAIDNWKALASTDEALLWRLYMPTLPFPALMYRIRENVKGFLRDNNLLELSDTNTMLSKVIGDDDAPFIYERIGSRLDHYLIDEFQDTSALQWDNIRPLLRESVSRSLDNLIIGDAKQSIYRFRNAEPKLINETVIRVIGADNVNVKGVTPQENTNWRSDRRIVEWNNRFFTFVVDSIGEYSEVGRSGPGGSNPFASVYANVIQDVPDGKDDKGFVRVYVSGVDKNAGKLDRVATTIELVEDALRRGYRLSDIAILTRNNAMGTEIVEAMRTYNLRNAGDAGKPVLEFVSEQSLLIGRSMAVMQIETVLDSIANGTIPDVNGDGSGKSPGNIHKLRCNILLYSRMHPEWPMARCMEEFINEEPDLGIIDAMLGEMQTTALPALVEAVIASFISPSLRRRDAVFLAAFQDCVLEYCESHPSDLPSFLKWWERARKSRAISSPEDVDAIRIMTIHKAKGLEFPVVIIPEIDNDSVRLGDQVGGRDWRWVPRSRVDFGDPALNDMLPPMMPVRINDSLAGTCLAGLLNEHYFLEGMDTLNVCYVAMTRAVGELYVMTELTGKDADAPARGWARLFQQFADSLGDEVSSTDDGEGTCIVEYGSRPEYVAKREKVADADDGVVLDDYHATHTPDCIKCREESMPEYADAEDLEEDDDPRSMGNVCHAIMERVIVAADIDREIMRARVRGLISGREEYLQPLRQALLDTSDKRVLGWFGGGAERVVTERPILNRRQSFKRPDRIMEWPASKKNALPEADIIDYKFGRRSVSKHRAQVRNYVGKLKDTGRYSRVRGWLWYVFDNADDNGIVLVAD